MEKGVVSQEGQAGIYALEERDQIVYVGRTRNLRKRLRSHISFSKRANKASFAFRRTRIETGKQATYKTRDAKKTLMKDPVFVEAYIRHIERIKQMTVRFVEIADPVTQYLFELYAHLEYDLPLDGFDTI